MEVDWPAFTLVFNRVEKRVTLKGDPTLTRLEVSLKRLALKWEGKDQGYWVELRMLTGQMGGGEAIVPTNPSHFCWKGRS